MESYSELKEHTLKCPICYEQFSSFHLPMIIPCGHTICQHCVDNLKKISNEDYEENYTDELLDDEFDISLNTDQEEDEAEDHEENEEQDTSQDQNHFNTSDSNQSGMSDEYDEENEEVEENSIEVEHVDLPDLSTLMDDGTTHPHTKHIPHHDTDKKIKLKCSICRKKMKILEDEIIINKSIMNVIESYEKQNEKLNSPNDSDNINIHNKSKKIFCKICRFVDLEKNHLINNSSHSNEFIELNQRVFNRIKNNVTYNEISDNPIDSINPFTFNHLYNRNKIENLNTQIIELISQFLDRMIKSSEFLDKSQDYIRNYFMINSKANYLKHKSFRKLTKLYKKFNKYVEEIDSITDKKTNINDKLIPVLKKAEDCLESGQTLVDKYTKIINVYLKNYEKIFQKENLEINNKEIIDLEIIPIIDKLIIDKSIKLLKNGFFESYQNNILNSERRYGTCVDNSSNLIYIYDLRVDNELEVDYNNIFESYLDDESSNEDVEKYFSDYIEIDEEGRFIYVIGKRGKDSKILHIYDMMKRTLLPKKKMPFKIGIPDRIFYKNKLFIIGGSQTDQDHFVKKCFYYDTQADFFIDLPDLNFERNSKSVSVCNDKIFVFGGNCANSEDISKFEYLDLAKIESKWNHFTIKNKSLYSKNSFYSFINENTFVILAGEDQNDDDLKKGFIIKFDHSNYNNSQVIEEFKLKIGMSNTFNVCSSFRGLLVGSRLNDGYFNKINFKNNMKKLKMII